MTHKKQRLPLQAPPDFEVQLFNVIHYPDVGVPISAVTQEPPLAGIVYPLIRGFSVPPQIGGPNLESFNGKTPGKPVVSKAVFRHTVYDVKGP
jgi:hypothetical protein